ncbi:hypothetical protein SYNPS1DRAFT_27659 [Syncephalis pseudoplumigaleata]|uniref:Core domain-containing protein n=1 Tax=Syncephalis pseudoplumigaleata TaxID=1712513 RepID=A0A4P9Z4A2_9FUNG|nr:hypothetical protein SYNPS1DRAFT_27659 [Syncephalis pseudoplumigaleata]|eukprot:RKP26661.1 hypothetical protein SYNPS1DRAFT_27659 [Syncephalis pseudoplumigaleata]
MRARLLAFIPASHSGKVEERAEAVRAMNAVSGDAMGMALQVTERAVKRIRQILKDEPAEAALRVAVDSGGCHGYQYRLELTHSIDAAEDIVFECDGARVVVDNISLPLLSGAQVDYVTELIGSALKVVSNPNASSTCGCDISFEIK